MRHVASAHLEVYSHKKRQRQQVSTFSQEAPKGEAVAIAARRQRQVTLETAGAVTAL